MRTNSPEQGYIHNLDRDKGERVVGQGFEAEKMVQAMFQKNFPNMEVRYSTDKEDSGFKGQGVGSKMVDVVVSEKTERGTIPSMALQVTTNADKFAIEKKIKEMKDMPFVRLEEMSGDDVS